MTADFLTIFIIVSLTQGAFVLFMLWRMDSPSRYGSIFLAAVILCFTWYQAEFLLIRNKVDLEMGIVYGTRFGSWLLLGPFLLLYIQSYFDRRFAITVNHLWHFAPFFVFTVLVPFVSNDVLTWRSVDYGMLTVFDNYNTKPITAWQYLYGVIFIVQFLHAGAYIALSLAFINRYEKRIRDQYSNFPYINFQWHRYFLLIALIIILSVSIIVLHQFATVQYRRITDYFYVIPMTGAIYLLLYHAIKYPNLIFRHEITGITTKYEKSSLAPNVARIYVEQLTHIIEDRQLYLNRELRLKDLADELNISTHHLSQAINEVLHRNFFEMINEYRIRAAKDQIAKDTDKSILQVAFEVGFNNKVSFNNAFKKYVGMTPSRFRQSA